MDLMGLDRGARRRTRLVLLVFNVLLGLDDVNFGLDHDVPRREGRDGHGRGRRRLLPAFLLLHLREALPRGLEALLRGFLLRSVRRARRWRGILALVTHHQLGLAPLLAVSHPSGPRRGLGEWLESRGPARHVPLRGWGRRRCGVLRDARESSREYRIGICRASLPVLGSLGGQLDAGERRREVVEVVHGAGGYRRGGTLVIVGVAPPHGDGARRCAYASSNDYFASFGTSDVFAGRIAVLGSPWLAPTG